MTRCYCGNGAGAGAGAVLDGLDVAGCRLSMPRVEAGFRKRQGTLACDHQQLGTCVWQNRMQIAMV